MKIPNSQNLEKQINPNQEQQIAATNFGGLNTTTSPLNVPYEDSPILMNCTIDLAGNVTKRKGTAVMGTDTNTTSAVVVPLTTALGYNYQVVKVGKDIKVYQVSSNQMVLRMTKANVWDSRGEKVRADYISTSEIESRIVFTTGYNVPIQCLFTERREQSFGTTTTVFNDSRFQYATISNSIIFIDGTFYPGSSFTFSYSNTTGLSVSANAGTVPNTILASGTHVVDIVTITWQWWAESSFFYGDRFYDTRNRFHDKKTDQNVEIPPNLRDDMSTIKGRPNLYPLTVYGGANTSTLYNVYENRQPQGVSDYSFGDGSIYKVATTSFVNLAPFFITFASVDSAKAGNPETVHILRKRILAMNGFRGVAGANLQVTVDDTLKKQTWYDTNTGNPNAHLNGTFGDYRLFATASDPINEVASLTALATDIDFGGKPSEIGVPKNAKVRITNKEPKFIGAAATNSGEKRKDGSWVPVYGLGLYANYNVGSFPRTCTTFQGRLVLSGFPHDPLLVIFSSTTDSTVPGEYYASFQQDLFTTLDTDPFDIRITSTADDYVTGLSEYQSSLFVFTRKGAYRVFASRSALTPTTAISSNFSSSGALNPSCVCKARDMLLFLSDDGLYRVTNQAGLGNTEYELEEISLKVRNKFSGVNPALPWVSYDYSNQDLYVGLSGENQQTAERLLVFTFYRQAWTEYDTPGRFNSFYGSQYTDFQGKRGFLLVVQSTNLTYLKLNADLFIDFATQYTATGTQQTYTIPRRSGAVYTTNNAKRYMAPFLTIPVNNVEDLVVYLDGVKLQFGEEYRKLPNGDIRLEQPPGTGRTLEIKYRRPTTDYTAGKIRFNGNYDLSHSSVYVNNVVMREFIDYTTTDTTNSTQVLLTATSGSQVIVGSNYRSMYTTPVFTWGSLAQYKRLLHWLGYFDNSFVQDCFVSSDVAPGQDPEEIVGLPKKRANANLTFVYNSDEQGETSADIYGFEDVVWDDALFSIDGSSMQSDDLVLVKEPIQGVGYSFQFALWTVDESTFKLCGYQLEGKLKGTKYQHYSQ